MKKQKRSEMERVKAGMLMLGVIYVLGGGYMLGVWPVAACYYDFYSACTYNSNIVYSWLIARQA